MHGVWVCPSQAQILAEMDEEFGVSNLVDATFKQEKEKVGVLLQLGRGSCMEGENDGECG